MDSDELLNGWFQSKHSEMHILFLKKEVPWVLEVALKLNSCHNVWLFFLLIPVKDSATLYCIAMSTGS